MVAQNSSEPWLTWVKSDTAVFTCRDCIRLTFVHFFINLQNIFIWTKLHTSFGIMIWLFTLHFFIITIIQKHSCCYTYCNLLVCWSVKTKVSMTFLAWSAVEVLEFSHHLCYSPADRRQKVNGLSWNEADISIGWWVKQRGWSPFHFYYSHSFVWACRDCLKKKKSNRT